MLVITRVLPDAGRAPRRQPAGDRPARLLARAGQGLPPELQDWGRAMGAELARMEGASGRWRFSLGCARALALIRIRLILSSREPGGTSLRAVALAGIGAAVALAAYGPIRYPELRSDHLAWAALAGFLVLVLSYAAVTVALSRSTTLRTVAARRHALVGGLAAGGGWFLVLSPPDPLRAWVLVPMTVALLGPACAAAIAARPGRDAAAGARAALWCGIVGGLVGTVAWVTAGYLRDGRPYDPGLLRDFHDSGASDLAAYAVRGDLATGLDLLVLIPVLALAFGTLAARLAAGRPRATA